MSNLLPEHFLPHVVAVDAAIRSLDPSDLDQGLGCRMLDVVSSANAVIGSLGGRCLCVEPLLGYGGVQRAKISGVTERHAALVGALLGLYQAMAASVAVVWAEAAEERRQQYRTRVGQALGDMLDVIEPILRVFPHLAPTGFHL